MAGHPPSERQTRATLLYVVVAVLAVIWLRDIWVVSQQIDTVSYSEFQLLLKEGQVKAVTISGNRMQAELTSPRPDGKTRVATTRVDPALAQELSTYGVKYEEVTQSSTVRDVLSWMLPTAVFFVVWMFLLRRMSARGGMGGELLSIGKSKARVYMETDTKVTFDDVAGVDEAKEELKETVGFLKDPKSYGRLGGRVPKGVLLVGPPGTGKTLLARAVAGEAGVPFFSISGSEFVEMFVGVGAARVRDLFEQASAKAPAIIFIDELDALGRARGAYGLSGHDEKEQTLNQLLVEMDGFDPRTGLVLLAATNRPEILDPALLRAGRFDRQVLVDRPDKQGRVQILKVHAGKVRLAASVSLEQVAAITPGFTGADLANLVNEAALVATRRGAAEVETADFTAAVERIVAGLEKRNRILNPLERKTVAYHEMGHALVAMSLPGVDVVHKVSIIPRGIGALGYTIQRPLEDRFLMRRSELENKMTVLLGGRAAEDLVFCEVSTGAADDLAKATEIAQAMVKRYGMERSLGQVAYEDQRLAFIERPLVAQERTYSEETASEIDRAVRTFIDHAFQRASAILSERRDVLERGAALLLAKETLAEDDLATLVASHELTEAPSGATLARAPAGVREPALLFGATDRDA
ncbi:MAG: ATP-dependent zinc metalloprotease FtsH [Burkholderiales bacterium]